MTLRSMARLALTGRSQEGFVRDSAAWLFHVRRDQSLGRVITSTLAALMLLAALLHMSRRIGAQPTVDFFNLWSVPHALAARDIGNIYDHDDQRIMADALRHEATLSSASTAQRRTTAITAELYSGRVDALGSPVIYALVSALSSGTYERDQRRFVWLLLCSFVLSMAIAGHSLGYPFGAACALIALCLISCAPLLADLRVANINTLQLLSLVGFAWAAGRRRDLLAGLLLGVGVASKLNTVGIACVFCIVLLARRPRYRRLTRFMGGFALGLLVAISASTAYLGRFTIWWQDAARVMETLGPSEYPLPLGNFGLASLARHSVGWNITPWVSLFLWGAVIYVAVSAGRGAPSEAHGRAGGALSGTEIEAWVSVGIGCIAMLLAAQLVWIHYYVLLLPLALFLCRPTGGHWGRPFGVRWKLATGSCFCLSQFVYVVVGNPATESVVLNSAALVMLVLALAELRASASMYRPPVLGGNCI